MIDYLYHAEQYQTEAAKIRAVIDRKIAMRQSKELTVDQRHQLDELINSYRNIYYKLLQIAHTLKRVMYIDGALDLINEYGVLPNRRL